MFNASGMVVLEYLSNFLVLKLMEALPNIRALVVGNVWRHGFMVLHVNDYMFTVNFFIRHGFSRLGSSRLGFSRLGSIATTKACLLLVNVFLALHEAVGIVPQLLSNLLQVFRFFADLFSCSILILAAVSTSISASISGLSIGHRGRKKEDCNRSKAHRTRGVL